ncbi:putative anti-sigma-YlaC factor YlaD [Pelomonas aquatica]|uniref:Anti-sigma-YlaC factor YlaD n=1 Tax=Pelomonas aquatica TaxID=431058 RepID=A0ABU1ZH92_9BURK|nr:zf-HC2 domain-containing protein [Pelomonas aquatica]MDR7299355.1 putative anti-sigma-YlaC factor YlaD [Pelomonas aquatica]
MIKPKITCREATEILLQGEDRSLPLAERLSLRLHQRSCGNCRRFARQVALMRQASARWRKFSED